MISALTLAAIIGSAQLSTAPQQIILAPNASAVVATGITNHGPEQELLLTAASADNDGLTVGICPAAGCTDPGIEAGISMPREGSSSALLFIQAPAKISPGMHWIWVMAYDRDWKLESAVTVTVMVPEFQK